ncbi:hypothetical protein [Streptomyces sp. NRRL B-12105]|uniref:hypothetical protein n=1 Tax=Streptomyces sp. NRRL B-12105 TaxID=1463827 RepID=UPI00131C84BB|nr:hypothetical protein [Streptomyces sp. NRRL B-12105]
MPRVTTDEQRAAAVRTFYGLDGSDPILAPKYLPSKRVPQGASRFESSMRSRLDHLARESDERYAGPLEAAALREAQLPLKERGDGWCIDRAAASTEAEAKAVALDLQKADAVRTFYGLDGSDPILARGYLPSEYAPQGASESEISTRSRLASLAKTKTKHNAGPYEAAALQQAQIPVKQVESGRWIIDKDLAGKESQVKAEAIDRQNAAAVRTFYGLDGSEPILDKGSLPGRRMPRDASEFEISTRNRLYYLTRESDGSKAGPHEAAALQDALIPVKQVGCLREWNRCRSVVSGNGTDVGHRICGCILACCQLVHLGHSCYTGVGLRGQ